ncbi:YczE/YyaS/YitT family protein [Ectobacillus ponti]|uniref:YitT family protein n=1 Tax=Ectobacillus ponti TaxID=2961894 RepID=A0AA41X9C9_9BACI|nr:YitT family protein [Ectobacillus ponti]MCP8969558.1 YitT family protein [Ectobacillus ponti]
MTIRLLRLLLFFGGLICFGLGNALAVQVKFLGIHPWEVLNVALYQKFGLTIGTWSVLCGLFLVCISLFTARHYISVGTFLNALLIGPIMDFFLWSGWLPHATHTWMDYLILLAGILITGIGGGMYVAGGLGAGPRDGFMLSISEKTGLSVSRARMVVESVVLVIGFLLGGPVFIVTFLYTFIQSPVFQQSLKIFRALLARLNQQQKQSSAESISKLS